MVFVTQYSHGEQKQSIKVIRVLTKEGLKHVTLFRNVSNQNVLIIRYKFLIKLSSFHSVIIPNEFNGSITVQGVHSDHPRPFIQVDWGSIEWTRNDEIPMIVEHV